MLKNLQTLLLIFNHIYLYGIKNNLTLQIYTITLGVLTKIFDLLLIVLLVNGIIWSILPPNYISLIKKLNQIYSLDLKNYDFFALIVICIIVIQIFASCIHYLHMYFQRKLIFRVLGLNYPNSKSWSINQDTYIVNYFIPAFVSFGKFATLLAYIFLLLVLISFFSYILIIAILPLIIISSIFFVMLGKKELKNKEKIKSFKVSLDVFRRASLKNNLSNIDYLNSRERFNYLNEKLGVNAIIDMKSNYFNIINTILIVIVILILSNAGDINNNISRQYAIFLIFAIRSLISSGKEISVRLSKVLEIRAKLAEIKLM